MPDLGELKVKVGADISGLLSKVDAARAKLNQLTETNQQLKAGLVDLNSSLRQNETELSKTAVQLKKVVDSGRGASQEAESLRKSFAGLSANSALLNKNISIGKAELAANSAQIKLASTALKEGEKGGSAFASGLTKAYSGLRTLANIIPGIGIGGLVGLIAGPVIDAFAEWFAAIDSTNGAINLLKANQQNLKDVIADANKEAGKQTADLRILYEAATNVNLSMKERLSAVNGLQKEFPDFFKNIKTETILNGGAKDAYDKLTESIIATSRAKAALGKLDELESKRLDSDVKIQGIKLNIQKQITEQAKADRATNATRDAELRGLEQFNADYKKNKLDQELITEQANNKSIKDQEDFLIKFAGLSKLASQVETNIKPIKVADNSKTKADIETITDVLEKLRIQIDFLNRKEIVLKTDEAQAKISAIESTIDHLLQKFKLNGDNAIILKLEAQINDIQLTEQFKKTFNQKGPINIPVEFQIDALPKSTLLPTDIETTTADALREKLKKLHVKLDINGLLITKGTPKEVLEKTLKPVESQLLAFQEKVSIIGTDIASALGAGLADLAQGGSGLAQIFQGLIGTLGDFLIEMGKGAVKAALLAIALKNIKNAPQLGLVAGLAAIVAGNLIKNFKIPGFAEGVTNFSGGLAVVGERGPELVRLPRGSDVIPNNSISGVNIGGGQSIQIFGNFELRNDRLVAAVGRGSAQINRNG